MSAFMCDREHISALAFAAVRPNRHGGCALGDRAIAGLADLARKSFDGCCGFDDINLTLEDKARLVCMVLTDANVASLAARYPRDHSEMIGDIGLVASLGDRPPPAAVALIKSVHCFQYQACEYDGFEDSLANRICQDIIADALHRLPGYSDAPWGAPPTPEGGSLTSLMKRR